MTKKDTELLMDWLIDLVQDQLEEDKIDLSQRPNDEICLGSFHRSKEIISLLKEVKIELQEGLLIEDIKKVNKIKRALNEPR